MSFVMIQGRFSNKLRKLGHTVLVAILSTGFSGMPGFAPEVHAGQSKPSRPQTLRIPTTPIVSGMQGRDLGYLPGSGSVSAMGQYSYTIPIEVSAGRAGMAPRLSLNYSSSNGNGALGVGWTLSGLSSITRCRQNLSTEGVANGVHLTDISSTPAPERDRYCLDGRKLMAINGSYGADQTEYRTEQDSYQRILSHATSPNSPVQGPDSFTVYSPDGQVRTYTGQLMTPVVAAAAKFANADTPIQVMWLLSSVVDSSGNGIQYNYKTVQAPDAQGATASQIQLQSIDYTTYNGGTAGAYRHVLLTYENRPDQEFTWLAGVKAQLLQRLVRITVSAPDTATTTPVWAYVIAYQPQPSSFSGRSLLSTVQRCSIQGADGKSPGQLGSCTWKKEFSYTGANAIPQFQASSVASATNIAIAPVRVPGSLQDPFYGPMPYVKVLDANGDGVDDILFQPGQTQPWTDSAVAYSDAEANNCQAPDACPAPPAAIAPLLMLGTRSTTPPYTVSPLAQSYDLSTDYGGDLSVYNNITPSPVNYDGSLGHYPWGALENLTPVDLDGSGKSSIFMTAPVGVGNCSYRALDWGPKNDFVGVGFNDRGAAYPLDQSNCNNSSVFNSKLQYSFADFDGDNRPDVFVMTSKVVKNQNNENAIQGNNIQIALNEGGNVLSALSPSTSPPSGINSSCPLYAVDFAGDGRTSLFGQAWDSFGCDSSGTYSYSPFTAAGAYPDSAYAGGTDLVTQEVPTTQRMPDLAIGTPANSPQTLELQCPLGPGTGSCGFSPSYHALQEYFGDFNGDGLMDVVTLDVGSRVMNMRWNTGNGFGPPIVIPPVAGNFADWKFGNFKILVADLNGDGRDDLLIFHENCPGQTLVQCPPNVIVRTITMMLSDGQGNFTRSDIPGADPGVITPEGWTTSTVGDFNGDGLLDLVDVVGGPSVNVVKSVQSPPPVGFVCAGNGDPQAPDNGCPVTNTEVTEITTGTLQVLIQQNSSITPAAGVQATSDLLYAVQDEAHATNREAVTYSPHWSDKPETLVCPVVSYPQHCLTKGMMVVRTVASWDTRADSGSSTPHEVDYSYEEPVVDLRGRGFLGFRKVRVWDPTRLQQTITLYDNVDETGVQLAAPPGFAGVYPPQVYQPGYYVGTERPLSVTTVTAIPASGTQTLPALPPSATGNGGYGPGAISANARVVQTSYNRELVRTHNGQTYIILPCAANVALLGPSDVALPCNNPQLNLSGAAQVTQEWEQTVSMAASVTDPSDPTSDYIWNVAVPTTGAVTSTTTINSIDAYANITAQSEVTTGGATRQSSATYNNLTTAPTWLIGQLASQTITVTDADPSVAPASEAVAFDYTPAGLLYHRYVCQQGLSSNVGACPSGFGLLSTTTLTHDNYGNVINVATQAQGPDGQQDTRQVNIEYDALWPSQPNERIFPSQYWSPFTAAAGGKDWTPSNWVLIHPAYGVTSATMDVNGVQSSAQYDDQGRPLMITPPVGAATTISYAGRNDQSSLGGINGMVVTSTTGGQTVQSCTDAAGRGIQSTHLGFDGSVVTDSYVQYDLLGRAVAAFQPYSGAVTPAQAQGPTYFAHTVYDGLNRVVSASHSDPVGNNTCNTPPDCISTTTYAYGVLNAGSDSYPAFTGVPSLGMPSAPAFARTVSTVTVTDPSGNQSQSETDIDSRTVATAHYLTTGQGAPGWLKTYYHPTPLGVDRVVMPSGAIEATTYDTLGRITGHYSPDMGTSTSMVYDGFNELLSITHQETAAKTSHSYEVDTGRPTGWSTQDPSSSVTTGATMTYDTQLYGLGKLASATSSDNVSIVPSYDIYGRTTSTTETVNGKQYTMGVTFDNEGRVSVVNYPAIGVNTAPGMALTNHYNNYEYLSALSDVTANPASNGSVSLPVTLYNINSRNVDGSLAQATLNASILGNASLGTLAYSYVPQTGQLQETKYTQSFDASGNSITHNATDLNYTYYPNGLVKTRTDNANGRLENFTYDSLRRLAQWSFGDCSAPVCTSSDFASPFQRYAYDPDGDLTSVSKYAGHTTCIIFKGQNICHTNYSWDLLQTNTYGGTNGGPHALTGQTIGSSTANPVYDKQGRQTSNGVGRTIVYNAFDLPKTVQTSAGIWTLQYDAFGHRVAKSGNDGTTVYIGGAFEQRIPPSPSNAGVTDVFKVPGVGQVETNESTGTTTDYFTVSDPLGSTATVVQDTSFYNSPRQTVTSRFYEPFGARINVDGTPYVTSSVSDVHEGFTGQEQDDDFGLINFRGRLYDSNLKRFLSTDPLVSYPGFSQSWNPYSYVLNSPLNHNDPTGFGPGDPDGPYTLAPGSEDDMRGVPPQAAVDAAIPPGWVQTSYPYALYNPDGSFCAWQVNVNVENADEDFPTYIVLSGFPPPTPIPGPQAPSVPAADSDLYEQALSALNKASQKYLTGSSGITGDIFIDAPIHEIIATGQRLLATVLGDDSGTGSTAEARRQAAADLDTNPHSTPEQAAALHGRSETRQAADQAINVAAMMGPGFLVKSITRGLAADAVGVVAEEAGMLKGPSLPGRNQSILIDGKPVEIPVGLEHKNGAFGYSSVTAAGGGTAQETAQALASATPNSRIFVLTGGHGRIIPEASSFLDNPALVEPSWYAEELPVWNALPLENGGEVLLLDGNNPEHLALFLEMESEAAAGGTNIFTIRDYCYSACLGLP